MASVFEVNAEFLSCAETQVQVGTRVDSSKEHHGFVLNFKTEFEGPAADYWRKVTATRSQ